MQDSKWLEKILRLGRKVIPKSIFTAAQPIYHFLLAITGAILYGFPSRKIMVVAVTGTKGKSTSTELLNAVFEAAGFKTALLNTIRFKIGEKSMANKYKMTLPGRFFLQNFLRTAADSGCTHAIVEMSSEGVAQFRHKFIYLDALIFTNLAPEHLESHGSYENYIKAKLEIGKVLENTPKNNPVIAVNTDDKEAAKFLSLKIKNKVPYAFSDAFNINADENGSSFQVGKTVFYSRLPGKFNVMNMLGVIALGKFMGISAETIKKGLESVEFVRGRMEKINEGQEFDVVVDYAHTPESLKAVYGTYKGKQTICVLGNTGGGRDKWKRKEMGKIANEYCSQIILTNEDPYDEDPRQIVEEMKKEITGKPCEIIMERRNAIFKALSLAKSGEAVLITGKGTDPYIMEANGKKTPWDDATVVREELQKLKASNYKI
jgi:UDP-N-acetylmuramoyl-L-alanyl-D-glutamate--2,6-diaminopimelate ligase